MVKANSSVDEKIETLVQLRCLEGWTNGIHGELTSISALNIFLAVTAFLGNTLILVSLRKESSLRPPSKLLLRCLAATDLCVGIIAQPFQVVYWLSLVYKDWNLCRYALNTTFITGYTLTSVSMLTLTAISVNMDKMTPASFNLSLQCRGHVRKFCIRLVSGAYSAS